MDLEDVNLWKNPMIEEMVDLEKNEAWDPVDFLG
jgi:hypothetical protein